MPQSSFSRLALAALMSCTAMAPTLADEAVPDLDAFIAREVADKKLPGLSIAVVDGPLIVWAKGFGFADAAGTIPAGVDTTYPIGSVSQLFTDLAVMKLADEGKLDIDAPVTTYLPDFRPGNSSGTPITLRQLMAHRSGLGRETPIGSTFDPAGRTLAEAVASLNRTMMIHPPTARFHESNAGVAVAGLALERVAGEPFDRASSRLILGPLGMSSSRFDARPRVGRVLASGVVATGFGREFPAPSLPPGPAPAVGMIASAADLGRSLIAMMDDSRVPIAGLPRPDTLKMMMTPQFVPPGTPEGVGLGIVVSRFQGHRKVTIGGGTPGFSADLTALPDTRLGVVVIASRDSAHGVVSRIADVALGQWLAFKEGRNRPAIETTSPLQPEAARELAGRYRSGDTWFDLFDDGGSLRMVPVQGPTIRLSEGRNGSLVGDDAIRFGPRIIRDGEALRIDDQTYRRDSVQLPPPVPDRFAGLIGEYGRDDHTLYILERDGKLNAVIGWVDGVSLSERELDVYLFPESSPYAGETLRFRRDDSGKAVEVVAASVPFARRTIDGEDGRTFRIKPTRPVADILRENDARGDKPPTELGDFRAPDLVDLGTVSPTIHFDIRYATDNNFLGSAVYPAARAFFQRPAAEALGRAHAKLASRGYGLLIHDSYRPWRITKLFYDATSGTDRNFVADPSKGSKHNRGCAVDLSLYDLTTDRPVEMVGGYDEFSDRSYPNYPGGTSRQRWLRDLLRNAMETEGFTVNANEWWHFDFQDWRSYPILDIPFSTLAP